MLKEREGINETCYYLEWFLVFKVKPLFRDLLSGQLISHVYFISLIFI